MNISLKENYILMLISIVVKILILFNNYLLIKKTFY
jgi:hypothetical protein